MLDMNWTELLAPELLIYISGLKGSCEKRILTKRLKSAFMGSWSAVLLAIGFSVLRSYVMCSLIKPWIAWWWWSTSKDEKANRRSTSIDCFYLRVVEMQVCYGAKNRTSTSIHKCIDTEVHAAKILFLIRWRMNEQLSDADNTKAFLGYLEQT